MHEIFRVVFGSHLYGTNTPESDTDYKSIHIPTARQILLQRVKDSTGHKVQRPEGEKNSKEDTDDESYSLQRYLMLLAQGQTVAIDMLFAPQALITSPIWDRIVDNRSRLLTKKSAAFVGYCRQQANKYGIKGSRVSSAKKAAEFFQKAVDNWSPQLKVGTLKLDSLFDEHTELVTKETSAGNQETYLMCCNRMVGLKNTIWEALGIYKRIYEEYGERARKAEANEGIDWKALSHAVRVGEEALELLDTGRITFPLPNKEHILQIKQGVLSYKEVSEEIEQLLDRVESASKISTLPEEPDYEWIDQFVVTHYGKEVKEYLDANS